MGGKRRGEVSRAAYGHGSIEKFEYLPLLLQALGQLPTLVLQLHICHMNNRQCYIFATWNYVVSQLTPPARTDRGK
jgi:hypothetical protein